MKKEIHPTYYKEASIKCACGAQFSAGSTDKEIFVEICSQCHPHYTGKQKLLDTAGRVDKFRAKVTAAAKANEAKVSKNKPAKEEIVEPEKKTIALEDLKDQVKTEDK